MRNELQDAAANGVKTLATSPAGFTHTLGTAGDVYAGITALVAEATGYTLELTGEAPSYSWAGHSESWLVELTR